MTNKETLDRVFTPQSVAIVGSTPREPAQLVLESLVGSGFRGTVYLAGHQPQDVPGQKVYASIADIPGAVDYVLCCAPAAAVLPLLRDCATRKVAAVAILTAGFSGSVAHEDVTLGQEISALAQATGVRVLGPDCLGVYSHEAGISFDARPSTAGGRMGLICQGREAFIHLVRAAEHRGVRFSKAISYGMACDLRESELLEYFAQDTDTDEVAVCIEDAGDGMRFFRNLRNLARSKPVIVLRTTTPSGLRRADLSTVGVSDKGLDQMWEAMLEQAGAVGVNSAEEMVDVMVAFAMLPVPRGRRIGIFGAAGGASVLATDAWSSAGFTLPPVPPELKATLDNAALNQAGMILHNPLDFSMAGYTEFFFDVVKRMIAHEGFVDLGIIHNPSGHGAWLPWAAFNGLIDSITHSVIGVHKDLNKPLALVMQYIASRQHWQKVYQDLQVPCSESGIPVYYTMASAARAIDRMLRYYERKTNGGQD
jgi:acyl-CoA synthetase (NDP forming)